MATSTRGSASLVILFLPLLFVSSSANNNLASPDVQVWSLCGATPFPDLCYQSTAALSPIVANDFTMLVRSLLGLCLDSAKAAAGYVKSAGAADGASLVRNCEKTMADAVEVLGLAAKEVGRLGRPGSQQYARCVETAVILTNTAVADADSCLRVLGEAQNGAGVPREVKETVMHTMQMSSIAVVFVNSLAPKN